MRSTIPRSSRLAWLTVGFAVAPFLLWATEAEANGRYPEAGQLVLGVTNPDRILVRATFGFLVSEDGGASWRWVCEQAIGFEDVFDPPIALLAGDVILAGLQTGLSRSSDFGCGFSFESDVFPGKYVIDVTADRGAPANGLAVSTTPMGTSLETIVASTTDGGATWQPTAAALETNFRAITIEVARSNPDRIYVTGLLEPSYEPVVAVSDDAGQSWVVRDNLETGGPVFISAVDPTDPDRVYARVPGNDVDTLYVSVDAAETVQEVAQRPGRMLGFALSEDGSRIAIGGPLFGIESADAMDLELTQRSSVSARCLTFGPGNELFVCGDEAADGWTIGSSMDEGATVTPLLTLPALAESTCEPTASICSAYWPGLRSLLGLDPSTGSGTTSPTTTTGGADDDETGDGCGCKAGGRTTQPPSFAWMAGIFAAALGAARVNRRRRSRRSSA